MIPDHINGYIPVPLLLQDSVHHYIYLKKHVSRDKSDEDRTIFVVNLPADTDGIKIKQLCQSLGGTIMEEFEQEDDRGQIKLVDKSSCSRLLNKAKAQSAKIKWPESEITGSKLYLALNRGKFLDQATLQRNVDNYMQEFAEREEEELRQVQQRASLVDEDGFTMVVSSNRKSGPPAAPKVLTRDQVDTTKKKKEKSDFYRFQLREQKKTEMNSMLRRYQADKEKVRQLREKKRFRPY